MSWNCLPAVCAGFRLIARIFWGKSLFLSGKILLTLSFLRCNCYCWCWALRPLNHPMSTTISFVLSRCPKFCLLSMNNSVQKGRPKNRETIPQLRTPRFLQSTTRWWFQTFHQYFSDGWLNHQPDKLSGKDSIIFDNLGGLLGCVPLSWGKRPISLPWPLLHKRCSVA